MKRLAFTAMLSLISFSVMASRLDPIDKRINRDKPTSPVKMIENEVEEFDPSAPDALEILAAYDQMYQAATGIDTMSAGFFNPEIQEVGGCVRASCHIWVNVVKNERPQRLYLYIDGRLDTSWKVSTASPGHVTPNWEGHPAGPFYPGAYTSHKFPGGDYKGLGNMPYASFYHGGFAIHGTPSIGQLGKPASHGCVRSHPDNAHYFSQLVRSSGASNVYVSISGNRLPVGAPALLSLAN